MEGDGNYKSVLPKGIIELVQQYVDGEYLYVQRKSENHKHSGEESGTKTEKSIELEDEAFFYLLLNVLLTLYKHIDIMFIRMINENKLGLNENNNALLKDGFRVIKNGYTFSSDKEYLVKR